jgi:hypothetical protein
MLFVLMTLALMNRRLPLLRKPAARAPAFTDFNDCMAIQLDDPGKQQVDCCDEFPSGSSCPILQGNCQAYFAGDTETDPQLAQACEYWCSEYEPDWCSGASGDDQKFMECLGNSDDYKKQGECAGKYPNGQTSRVVAELCQKFYNDDKVPEEYSDEVSKDQADALCDGYCSEINTKPGWCSSGLSAGAIAGIVIAAVVVVGAIVGVLVYFFVIKKKQPVEGS